MKSSFVKSLEHIDEFLVNSHLTRFCFTKSIYFFLRFLASSLSNSIACRAIPFYTPGKAAHSPTFLAHSKFSTENVVTNEQMLCGRDTGSTSQASSSQSLNCSLLYSIWRKKAYFKRLSRLIKTKRNTEYNLFLRKTS